MIQFLNIFNLFLSGFLLSALFWRWNKEDRVINWLFILKSIFWSVILVSLVGLVLFELNVFFLVYFQVIFVLINIVLLGLNFRYGNLRALSLNLSIDKFGLVFILLLILNVFLKLPVGNHIYGGADAGVYINVANQLSLTGTIKIEEPLLKEAFTNKDASFLKKYYDNVYGDDPILKNHYEGGKTPGYYIVDKEKGEIIPQFFHLHPIWLSLSSMIFGPENTPLPLFFFAMLSLPFFYLFLNFFIKNRWLSLFCLSLYSVNILTFWVNKYPVSETLAFFFMITGLYYLHRIFSNDTGKISIENVLFFGLSLGFFSFVRADGVGLLPLLSLIYLILPHRKNYVIAFNIYFIFLGWSILHALSYSFPYYFDVLKSFGITIPKDYLLWFLILFVLYIISINFFKFYFKNFTEKTVQYFKNIAAKKKSLVLGGFSVIILLLFLSKVNNFAISNSGKSLFNIGDLFLYTKNLFFDRDTFTVALFQLIILLTPLFYFCSLIGLYKFYKNCENAWIILFFWVYMFIFEYILVFSEPNLLYSARYQFAVMFPLSFLLIGIFFKNYSHPSKWLVSLKGLILLIITVSFLAPFWMNPVYAGRTELSGSYDALSDMAQYIKNDSVIFLDTPYSGISDFIAAPLMYSFQKGITFNSADLMGIYEDGGKIMGMYGKNVYIFVEKHRLDESSLSYKNFELVQVTQGIMPVRISARSSKFPEGLYDSLPPYYLYQLVKIGR